MNIFSPPSLIRRYLNTSKKIVILSHQHPDADAVGSSLALFFILKKLKKSVHIILPNAFPEFLNWMPSSEKIIRFDENQQKATTTLTKADLIFLLDCNSFKRLGTDGLSELSEQSAATKILIDHHKMPDGYFNGFYFDDKASSTCELIYRFIQHLKLLHCLDKKTAQCIYTGLMTDTGSFKYDSVTANTMRIAAHLLEFNIKHTQIQQNIFDTYSYDRLKLVGYALSKKLKYLPQYKASYIALSQRELKKFNYKRGDTEGLVNMALSIKDVQIAALFTETDKVIRVSLRSKNNLDVNTIARKYFKGGGHKNAAGGQMCIPLEEVTQLFEKIVQSLKYY